MVTDITLLNEIYKSHYNSKLSGRKFPRTSVSIGTQRERFV